MDGGKHRRDGGRNHVAGMAAVLALLAGSAHGDVCVWRDPERTMSKLFPSAVDYRTVTRRVTADLARRIEDRVGMRLDDSERAEFNYYEITGRAEGGTKRIGTVLALAGRGDYGTVEVVVGLGTDDRVVGVYIQRMRERQSDKLRSDAFLGQFRGKSHSDSLELGRDIRPVEEAMTASRAVTVAVRKMLVFYDELKAKEANR